MDKQTKLRSERVFLNYNNNHRNSVTGWVVQMKEQFIMYEAGIPNILK